jgi:hypothetical protein
MTTHMYNIKQDNLKHISAAEMRKGHHALHHAGEVLGEVHRDRLPRRPAPLFWLVYLLASDSSPPVTVKPKRVELLQNASPTERTRPARHESATRRCRQRDRAPRVPLRRTQPKSPRPSALPGAAPAERLRSLYAADDGQKSVYGYWPWTWCDGRVWSVSGTCLFLLLFSFKLEAFFFSSGY